MFKEARVGRRGNLQNFRVRAGGPVWTLERQASSIMKLLFEAQPHSSFGMRSVSARTRLERSVPLLMPFGCLLGLFFVYAPALLREFAVVDSLRDTRGGLFWDVEAVAFLDFLRRGDRLRRCSPGSFGVNSMGSRAFNGFG